MRRDEAVPAAHSAWRSRAHAHISPVPLADGAPTAVRLTAQSPPFRLPGRASQVGSHAFHGICIPDT